MKVSEIRNRVENLSEPELKLLVSKINDLMVYPLAEINTGTKRVIAYISPNNEFNREELKSYLKKNIPDYMIPSVFHLMPEILKLPNGKLDRNALASLTEIPTNEALLIKPKTILEKQLVALWEEVLQVSPIGINDNFFELGGDSILSIQLIAKTRQLGIQLSPNQLFEHQNIKELSLYITLKLKKLEEWDYLVPLRKTGMKNPVFCIHAGGGHVFFYNKLKNYIPKDRPIYALQPSGLYGEKQMHKSIEAMTSDYLQAIETIQQHGPYNIMVYCYSAVIGHEMVLQLKGRNKKANLIVIDTMAKPWTLNTPNRFKIRFFGFYKRLVKQPIKTVRTVFQDRWGYFKLTYIKIFGTTDEKKLEKLRSNLIVIYLAYKWKKHTEKITLIITKKVENKLNEETLSSWQELTGGVTIVNTAGDHRTLFDEPDVKYVAKKIEESCL